MISPDLKRKHFFLKKEKSGSTDTKVFYVCYFKVFMSVVGQT